LSLRDNGEGIRPDDEHNGRLGLHLIRYCANIVGGDCRIEPVAGGGTLVRCEVPLRAARAI
jgi:nitrate/nitrite-specific signal transduction histidine kinase